ncbi:hypothetical protein E2C01_069433 [Portunus trituberculatus]|uniref:Uncharacterized protein n=1 Tax=Portunus trituberculatus TaxID=210409 RepID=A0A5B7HZJ1_PORTR|nr:hypothetical protein [Portunus trituberculatus]
MVVVVVLAAVVVAVVVVVVVVEVKVVVLGQAGSGGTPVDHNCSVQVFNHVMEQRASERANERAG